LASNDSNTIYIQANNTFTICDLNLKNESNTILDSVEQRVGETTVDLVMSNQYAFFLCNTKQALIFDLKMFNLVKVIDTNACRIKILSNDWLVLYDSSIRAIVLHESSGDFDKDDEISCVDIRGYNMINDNSDNLTFYDDSGIDYFKYKLT
jgi:hypothetical protein